MKYFKGITFAPFCRRGALRTQEARDSLKYLAEHTGANSIILAPAGLQENAHSEVIDYSSEGSPTDEELIGIIRYAKELGLQVAIKPTVNCKSGDWRAFISFFDHDVVCEPKWGNWFRSYTEFQTHYAKIAQEEGCEMFIAGCEMVMSEHREQEWREVIAAIRECYDGPVSYNTDKYQEDHVTWWDCVDIISSSGYYPTGQWEEQLDRIEAVVKKFGKPFFFAEAGCMSREGSCHVPNDWGLPGELRLEEQPQWYKEMFEACQKRSWVGGFGLWEWAPQLPKEEEACMDSTYEISRKPVEAVIRSFYDGVKNQTL